MDSMIISTNRCKRDSTPSQVSFHWNGTVEQRDQIISVLMDYPFFNEGLHVYMIRQTLGNLFGDLLKQHEDNDEE